MMSSGKAFRLSVTLDGTDPVTGGRKGWRGGGVRGRRGGAALTNQQSIRPMSRACSGQSALTLSVVFPFQRSQKDDHYAHTGCTGCGKSGFQTQRLIIRHTYEGIFHRKIQTGQRNIISFLLTASPG